MISYFPEFKEQLRSLTLFFFFFSAILVVTRLAFSFKFTTDKLLSHSCFVFCISFSNLDFIVVIIITVSTI